MGSTINQDKCKKCKLCIEICPCNILELTSNDTVEFIESKKHICIKCGQCMAICNAEAIVIEGYSYEKNFKKAETYNIDYDNLSAFLQSRRSIRHFKDQEVSNEVIQQILDTLKLAPYGSAPDEVHMTVVNNRKVIEESLPKMSEFFDKIVKYMESPFMRFMIKKKKGIEVFNTLQNHLYPIAKAGNYKLEFGDRITRNAPAMIIFHASIGAEEHTNNSLIYATYCMMAAQSLGLGSTMVGLVPAAINKVPEVRSMFKIPDGHEAVISLILGYPKFIFKKTIVREKTNINWLN
jgi:nitroreductase/NAD-dependent dihydropyrimidine dehydrogenase PreA subunit